MNDVIGKVGDALLMSAGMAWSVGWSLVLGFVLSGCQSAFNIGSSAGSVQVVAVAGAQGHSA